MIDSFRILNVSQKLVGEIFVLLSLKFSFIFIKIVIGIGII